MSFPPDLRFFAAAEFHHPEQMDPEFLYWLDAVRKRAGLGFFITSDFRTPVENAEASGSSSTSLHLRGRAVDFVIQGWTDQAFWDVAQAVVLSSFDTPRNCGIEFEIVNNPGTDRHFHVGLFPVQCPHRLEVRPT